jgi:hypothetical protein
VGKGFYVLQNLSRRALGHTQPPKFGAGALAGGKQQRRGVDHPPLSSAEVRTEQSYNSTSRNAPHGTLQGELKLSLLMSLYMYIALTLFKRWNYICCFLPLHCVSSLVAVY